MAACSCGRDRDDDHIHVTENPNPVQRLIEDIALNLLKRGDDD